MVLATILLLSNGCSKNKEASPCTSFNITTTETASDPCIPTGSIMITSPAVATGFRLNGSNFQTDPLFNALLPGIYLVEVKLENCIQEKQVTLSSYGKGPLFSSVKAVLAANCIGCHSGPNPQAGHDWTNDCAIVRNWDRIKARAVDANPTSMPPAGPINVFDRDKIVQWINAGHRYTD